MRRPLQLVTLAGAHVTLEPLSLTHVDDLVAAASVDRATYDWTLVPDGADAMRRYVTTLLAERDDGDGLPFAQRHVASGRLVGCTRYLEPRWWRGRPEPDEVEIGGTWLAADAQRTPVNTEAKLLLLDHAFETLGVWRVAICTDARNARSRTAIERIGAEFEGVLRNHRTRARALPAVPRDTAVYSVVESDWPAVRDRLTARLEPHD